MKTLESLHFDNHFAALPSRFFSRVMPTPLPSPYLVHFNAKVAQLLDLDPAEARSPDFAAYFAGNRVLSGSVPLAMLYAGHQFGHFVPQLGDGRAILLGQIRNSLGQSWDLQLKGAGQTPYSRHGDGRAVLRSTIREYLCSEAMHGLGIPTTRGLAIVGSDFPVYREAVESAAVLTRVAPSHVRFGSFEVFFYRNEYDAIGMLADYVITQHFAHLTSRADRYEQFLREVIGRTARLVADWQAVGFAHGVMNTDNMSILGLTFDYGPFGFVERYDPDFICNHSDENGRYAFSRQPQVARWNLFCLAQALTPLISVEACKDALADFENLYASHYIKRMCAKLGLGEPQPDDASIISQLLDMMQQSHLDYTDTFRRLCAFNATAPDQNAALRDLFVDRATYDHWAAAYAARLQQDATPGMTRRRAMEQVNPLYILRNHLAQAAIVAAQDDRDFSGIDKLISLLQQPFDEQPDSAAYAAPPEAGASPVIVSCSS